MTDSATVQRDAPLALDSPGTGPIVNCKGCGTHFAQGSATQVYCQTCLDWIATCSWLGPAAAVVRNQGRGWKPPQGRRPIDLDEVS